MHNLEVDGSVSSGCEYITRDRNPEKEEHIEIIISA